MLDGTDLNDAYTLIRHELQEPPSPPKDPQPSVVQQPKPQQQQHTTLQQLQQLQQQQKSLAQPQQQLQPRLVIPAPIAMLPPVQPQRLTQPPSQPQSYLEALVQQRRDMLKYIVLSFVILLALACHNAIKFGFKEYILANDLSFKQELALRLGYPVAAFILLWNMRALSK